MSKVMENSSYKLHKIGLVIIVLFSGVILHAQDVNFTQFYNTPLLTNPANTGRFDGDWRIANSYRSQWAGFGIPFTSIAISYDQPLNFNDHKISAGGMLLSDKAGDGSLMRNAVYLSGSYYVLQGRNTLIVGLQPGLIMQSVDAGNLLFPDQYSRDMGRHDPNSANGEAQNGNQVYYADINAGIYFRKRMGWMSPEFGFTAYHINMPNRSFIESSESNTPLRSAIYLASQFRVGSTLTIWPKLFMTIQGSMNYAIAGGLVKYNFSSQDHKLENIYAGAFVKNNVAALSKALSFTAGLKFMNFDIGVSYDSNPLDFKSGVQNLGGFEISIIYTSPSFFHQKIAVPCERM